MYVILSIGGVLVPPGCGTKIVGAMVFKSMMPDFRTGGKIVDSDTHYKLDRVTRCTLMQQGNVLQRVRKQAVTI